MSELAKKKCVPCKGGIPSMEPRQIQDYLTKLGGNWKAVENQYLYRLQ